MYQIKRSSAIDILQTSSCTDVFSWPHSVPYTDNCVSTRHSCNHRDACSACPEAGWPKDPRE